MASIDKETALQIARFGWLAAQSSNKYIIEMAEEDLKGFVDDETKKHFCRNLSERGRQWQEK